MQTPVRMPLSGCKAFKKKDDDMSFFTSVQKGKPAKGGKGAAASSADKAPAPVAAQKLNHSLDTLGLFMQFGIPVPKTTTEIPATIEKVGWVGEGPLFPRAWDVDIDAHLLFSLPQAEAKRAEYLEKRKRSKEAPSPKKGPKTQELPTVNGNHVAEEEELEEEPEVEEAPQALPHKVEEEELVAPKPAKKDKVEVAMVVEAETEVGVGRASGDVGVSLVVDKLSKQVSVKLSVTA